MSELLPCPFCGGEAELHPTYDMDTGGVDGWFAWCDNDTCECKPETGQFFTEAEAIAAWNTRTPEQAIAATLGNTTCEYVIEDNMNESGGMGDVWFRCTNCGTRYDYIADDWLLKMPHCPKCGATVKGVR